jgi:hypothetical protein
MNLTPTRLTDVLLVACCVLAGCRGAEEEAGPTSQPAVAVGDSVYSPTADRVSLPPGRIYYTLTTHDWYARGEPLVFQGREYRPSGMPQEASLTEMTKLGDFQGVEFYGRSGVPPAAVYVPVFEGYWQQFRTDAAVVDTTASAAPPPDPDSAAARS